MKFFPAAVIAAVLMAGPAGAHYGADHSRADHYHVAQASGTAAPPAKAAGKCDRPGEVSLAGEVILRIHAPAGGLDCQQRADKVQMRIVDSLSVGLVFPRDITVRRVKNEWAVFVKDILIITADAYSARVNNTDAKTLAEIWARNLRRTVPESTPQKPL